MFTSHRMWQVGFVMLLALAASSPARGADPKLLPNDTEIVFTINVKQILDSPLLQSNKDAVEQAKTAILNQLGDHPAAGYLKSAGFDIFRDLHSITVANNGNEKPTAMIIRGTFDAAKIAATAEQIAKDNADALKIKKVGNQTVYEITPPRDETGYATLIDGKVLLIMPTMAGLMDTWERLAGTKQSTLKKELTALLGTVSDKQSVTIVATGAGLTQLARAAPVADAVKAATELKSVDGLSGAITVGKEVQFQLGINAKDEASAKKMAIQGTGAILGVQLLANQYASKDERFAPVVDIVKTLRVTSQGNNVLLTGTVSLEVIEKVMKTLQP
jgi:hypothetical protein